MAKQTFTTGQVLTAAQMTSLQQTAMGGGSPSTKTASYVLVAADAGTVIQMNSASSTTITVNTSLFAAGDTVFIQNIGAGTCTVTAGTATVTTAGSLALTQWEGGTLYFTSTSASIFFDYIQAGVSIPLTTKGDLFGFDTANARVPIGSNGQVLTADSTQTLGLKWATPSSGALTLISSTTIGTAVSTVAVSNCFSSTYENYKIIVYGGTCTSNPNLDLVLGSTTTGYYYFNIRSNAYSSVSQSTASNGASFPAVGSGGANALQANFDLLGPNLAKRTQLTATAHTTASGSLGFFVGGGFQDSNTQFTGFTLGTGGDGTITGGTIRVYGYSN